jgi:hypothetical protein
MDADDVITRPKRKLRHPAQIGERAGSRTSTRFRSSESIGVQEIESSALVLSSQREYHTAPCLLSIQDGESWRRLHCAPSECRVDSQVGVLTRCNPTSARCVHSLFKASSPAVSMFIGSGTYTMRLYSSTRNFADDATTRRQE